MNKHPMLTVKEAAQIMGCDERWVRERLNQGQLKGEKRNIGLKEKWYVYAGEVESALEKRKGVPNLSTDYLASVPPVHTLVPPAPTPTKEEPKTIPVSEGLVVVDGWVDEEKENDNEADSTDKSEERLHWLQEQRQALAEMAEEMMRPLQTQLEEKNTLLKEREKSLQAATYQLGYTQGRLKDQEEQIKLLPDFQARAEKAELLKQEVEAAKARAEELEANLIQVEKTKQEEIEQLLQEKELLKKNQQEELEALKTRIAGLEQSWWKKFFGVGPKN
jgi:hypothetical protein